MAAQVEVKAGEGTRAGGVGGRLHLSPLADSSNKSPVEAPSGTQAPLIIAPEPCKPVPGPKPRLTPKPFNLEKNPTIRPIPAPRPNPKPRPEPTRLTSSKLDVPGAPKPATTKPAHAGSHRPVPTTPKCPSPASIKPSPKPTSTQTAKPAVQPRKPGPLPTPEKPAKLTVHEPVKSQSPRPGLPQKSSAQAPPAAEWSGTTPGEGERMQGSGRVGAPIVRAKSMGFLSQVERADEKPVGRGKAGGATEAPVPLRPQPKGSKPRPVSAILLPATTQSESPSSSPSSRWVGRRPLSADLTAKFESIGLSLHRRPGKADSKENTPERGREDDSAPIRKKEREKGTELTASSPSTSTPTSDPERKPKASVPERESEKKGEEEEELKSGASIKRRISLLFDSSSSSPTGGLSVAGAEPSPTTQPITDSDIPVGVKQRIKKLTEEIPPMQTPSPKVAFKPRPLPADLTKRFATEKPVEPSSPSPSSLEREGPKDLLRETSQAQGKVEDSTMDLTDGAREARDERPVFQFPQDQLTPTSVDQPGASMDELRAEFEPKGVYASGGMQTVRASLFENVVERHSVHVVEEPGGADGQIGRTVSVRRRDSGDDGLAGPAPTDVGIPASPLRVEHVFNIVSAAGEKRAVVECVPLAQLEDKAMTLRSRRSGADGMTRDGQGLNTPPWTRPQKDLSKEQPEVPPQPQEQAPRYLRVGALMKWGADEMERKGTAQVEPQAERGHWVEHDRPKPDGTMQVELEKDRFRESERVEVAAPKRLKILEGDDPQPKPKATYFALTGQMQEPQHVDDHSVVGSGGQDVTVEDFSMKTGRWGSQGPLHRNPSLDAAFSQSSQNKSPPQGFPAGQDLSPMDRTVVREMETEQELQTQRDMDWERHRELERQREIETLQETERERLMEIDRQRDMNSQLLEKQHHAQKERLERLKELERQREAERQREVERQIELKWQRETEKQREIELERQREVERERQREMEKERQREMERERRREIEREKLKELERDWQREMGRDRLKEFERERQKEFERERQKEFERERQKQLERERLKELRGRGRDKKRWRD
ncbi:hypothetical protein GJAV_G00030980 [Gymnothorax javanicus]|nr:hypothetical protein GJAV_G00030980 [Gymnothorax javanicus]